MSYVPPLPLQVWIADPRRFRESRAGDLLDLLDAAERERLARFRHEADARAYLLAHALRRAAVAKALEAPPGDIAFSQDADGKPLLEAPQGHAIFFSHSRRREGVACVVTRAGAVGIDVECTRGQEPEFALLAPHMVLPDATRRAADMGCGLDRQFRHYWTALEAYWKAQGTGLAESNPRVRCTRDASGEFEVAVAGDPQSQRARLFFLPCASDLTVAVALQPFHEDDASNRCSIDLQVHHCNSSIEIYNSSMA